MICGSKGRNRRINLEPWRVANYLNSMTKRTILIAPDPRLKVTAKEIPEVTDEIRQLADDMLETMYDANGVGLAGPQIGAPWRIVVIDTDQKDDFKNPRVLINPVIVDHNDEFAIGQEGCLSVPDIWEEVERATKVTCEFLDRDGKKQTVEAEGLLGVCIQHEIDHLNGTLFIDHLSRLKRSMALKKLKKLQKQKEA